MGPVGINLGEIYFPRGIGMLGDIEGSGRPVWEAPSVDVGGDADDVDFGEDRLLVGAKRCVDSQSAEPMPDINSEHRRQFDNKILL